MKKWGIFCSLIIVLLTACAKEPEIETTDVQGVVMSVSDQRILISQKETLTEADFEKSLEEILLDPSYNLMWISGSTEKLTSKTKIKATLEGAILESYPPQATAKKIEILGVANLQTETTDGSYNQELSNIFPQTVKLEQRYSGYAEYGHIQTLTQIKNENHVLDLIYNGEMHDGYGDFDNRKFNITYSINKDSVTETIKNNDPHSVLQQDDLLVSIIPNKIILKSPLEVGNSWLESFTYKGETYSAKTSITKIVKNEEDKMQYETLTIVEGIEGYYDEVYKETRVFVEGTGLTSFSNLFSMQVFEEQNENLEPREDLYMFGFGLSSQRILE